MCVCVVIHAKVLPASVLSVSKTESHCVWSWFTLVTGILLLELPCPSVVRDKKKPPTQVTGGLGFLGHPLQQIYVFWQLLPPVSTGKKTHEGGQGGRHEGGQGGRGSGVGGPELGVQGRGPGGRPRSRGPTGP